MQIIKPRHGPRGDEGGAIAQVSYAQEGSFGAVGASEIRSALVFAPRGIAYLPCVGDNLLLLPVGGSDTCVGALTSTQGLKPGELKLFSPGGASILLDQNGDIRMEGRNIYLNGAKIDQNGAITPP